MKQTVSANQFTNENIFLAYLMIKMSTKMRLKLSLSHIINKLESGADRKMLANKYKIKSKSHFSNLFK